MTERSLDSTRVYDGRIIGVRVDTVALPDGARAVREVVEHRPSVVVVPVDAHDNVLLVRQYRYAVGLDLLEAPAGMVEDSESAEECAQRELREETGYGAGELRPLGGFWLSPGFCTEFMHAFLATDLVESRLEPDDDESITVVRVPVSEAVGRISSGEIRDAKTICVLLLVERLYRAT